MSVVNQIASFGRRGTGNAGAGIGYGLQARRMRDEKEYRNKLLALDEQKREQNAMLKAEQEERAYGQQWLQAVVSAPEEARQDVIQGGYAGAVERGYMPPGLTIDDAFVGRLAGELGVDLSGGRADLPSGVQEFNHLADIIQNPNKYPDSVVNMARIDAGLDPRAGTVTGTERIANTPGQTGVVAASQARIEGEKSGAKESAKLEQQARLLPGIKASVKQAEVEAKARGETLSEYQKAKAALPGLTNVVDQLTRLADVATYTKKGQLFDATARELGFAPSEGATARAKMISMVDNQILPLLRQTFGAAFTAEEGNRLRDTMLNADLAPEEKKVQLNAFIEQKTRNLEAQEAELGVTGSSPTNDDPLGLR